MSIPSYLTVGPRYLHVPNYWLPMPHPWKWPGIHMSVCTCGRCARFSFTSHAITLDVQRP